ncbi:hypothetical protein Pmar_PMAR029213 [Perkinsus marinus ATCC 50983]|uniref:Uncharacterized protein n=1 Tax=Perkinsus marinus (strain ATCC 50983 / TXsc) TaxID=423536 RepID=C5KMJ2_PERM5|nr:hypothetical protein Pmar_PMAR029213 [Perkinsus marinus ATCC 50983]EER14150.1 hypothetical protein Pmar_PMAR029213 [Perkinsus marinus ATCC 50983]|eukprot:XP_002782355.1 hypothetical protein Pmar_PMAR029213 [Perkinsus marinus ATCC 50983]
MHCVIFLITLASLVIRQAVGGSALIIAEKLHAADGGYCQSLCDASPDCIFSYCGDDNICHDVGSAASSGAVPCGAAVTSFDSCSSACESVADCSASQWKSFCKTWLDTPVCFGLLQSANGLCYEVSAGCTGTAYPCP